MQRTKRSLLLALATAAAATVGLATSAAPAYADVLYQAFTVGATAKWNDTAQLLTVQDTLNDGHSAVVILEGPPNGRVILWASSGAGTGAASKVWLPKGTSGQVSACRGDANTGRSFECSTVQIPAVR